MIGLFLVYEVMEPQRNYMRGVSTNSHGCFVVTFPALHVYFIYIKHTYFATLMKYILELLGTLFCENMCQLIRS
jgi:hypothetical protein